MAAWDFNASGPYVFAFSPSRDDLSEVKVGDGWHMDPINALPGNDFACCYIGGPNPAGEDGWLYSAPFKFEAGKTYEAGIKYKLVRPAVGNDPPRLRLRLGSGQDPGAQTEGVAEFSASNLDYDVMRTTFSVPADGEYHFSLEAIQGDGVIALGVNAVAEIGQPLPF